MPNYALYAMFDQKIEEAIKIMIGMTHDTFPEAITMEPNEAPHLTILYGPELPADQKEITEYKPEDIEHIYPGLTHVCAKYMDLNFVGVSHFKRDIGYIIKLEFTSDRLTDLTRSLRKAHPVVDAAYLKSHETDGDLSRSIIPVRWLHCTIGVVPDVKNVPVIEEYIRNLVLNYHNTQYDRTPIPLDLNVNRFVVISAVTDTPIDIPVTKC